MEISIGVNAAYVVAMVLQMAHVTVLVMLI